MTHSQMRNSPKMNVRSLRLVVSIIIAVAAVGCKTLFPNATASVTGRLHTAVSTDWDYESAIERIKTSMTSGSEIRQLAYDIYSAVFFPENSDASEVDADEEKPGAAQPPQDSAETGGEEERTAQELPVLSFRSYNLYEYLDAHDIGKNAAAAPGTAPAPDVNETIRAVRLAFEEDQSDFSALSIPPDASAGYTGFDFSYEKPLAGPVTSLFGYRVHPITKDISFHYGVDLGAETGQRVNAFAAGTVEEAGYDEIYGKYILISHPGGVRSFYAHLDTIGVNRGESVDAGQMIGTAGSTGLTTGAHLHFGLRCGSYSVNPLYYIGGSDV